MKYENWLFGKDGALFRAAAHGRLDLTWELISMGANVNATSNNGFTPLHRASEHGHIAVVKFLLSKGANVNAKSEDGNTPLSLALRNRHKDIANLLKKSRNNCK